MQSEPPKADPPKRKRRWFQFSLRSLMIFTLLCAIPCAWLGRKIEQKRREREAVEAIGKSQGEVLYDYQIKKRASPPGPNWIRKVLGENFFDEVVSVDVVREADIGLVNLQRLTAVRSLGVYDKTFTDNGLANLKGLNSLRWLNLSNTQVTDAGLANLKELPRLQTLGLSHTTIGDAGLVPSPANPGRDFFVGA